MIKKIKKINIERKGKNNNGHIKGITIDGESLHQRKKIEGLKKQLEETKEALLYFYEVKNLKAQKVYIKWQKTLENAIKN